MRWAMVASKRDDLEWQTIRPVHELAYKEIEEIDWRQVERDASTAAASGWYRSSQGFRQGWG